MFPIDPVALEVGPFAIRWYGIIMATAFMIGTLLAYSRASRAGIDPDHIISIVAIIIPAAIIGSRLYYVAFNWSEYSQDPIGILAVWHGGLAIHGGIIGGVLAGLWFVRKYHLSAWNMADVLAPSLIIGQAIGRWGNFINQEAYGGPVSEEFISAFPAFIQKQMYIDGQYYHPAFLYESLWDFGIFLVLTYYWSKRRVQGEVAALYLILYSIGRFFIEGLRTDSLMLGSYKVAQIVSLLLIIAGILIIYFRRKDTTTSLK